MIVTVIGNLFYWSETNIHLFIYFNIENTSLPFLQDRTLLFHETVKFNKYATQNFSSTISPVFNNLFAALFYTKLVFKVVIARKPI